MIAARQTRFNKHDGEKVITPAPKHLSKRFDKNSFSAKNIFRKHRLLSGFHRSLDGALLGVIVCAALMSALALHSQYLWTLSFSRLEMIRDLNQRLEESSTNLERYFLDNIVLSKHMVQTKATDLLYIDALDNKKNSREYISKLFMGLNRFTSYPIRHGY